MTDDILEESPGATAASAAAAMQEPAVVQDAAVAAADPGVLPGGPGEQAAAVKDLGPLKEVLEALVFVHRGILPPKTVREVLGEEFTAEEIAAGFAALKADYEERGGALVLVEVAGGYQFGTRADLAPWIRKLDFYEHHRHLSRPTLETLAIIAYKQPVTRAEIEGIRGVNVERIVRNLLERKLVRILGHKDVPGKPMVLGTTREFLELFGLNSLAGLPPLKDFGEPPSTEGIDEDLTPAAASGEGTGPGGGAGDDTAAAADAAQAQETEHGAEQEIRDGEPTTGDTGGDPAAGTAEAG